MNLRLFCPIEHLNRSQAFRSNTRSPVIVSLVPQLILQYKQLYARANLSSNLFLYSKKQNGHKKQPRLSPSFGLLSRTFQGRYKNILSMQSSCIFSLNTYFMFLYLCIPVFTICSLCSKRSAINSERKPFHEALGNTHATTT